MFTSQTHAFETINNGECYENSSCSDECASGIIKNWKALRPNSMALVELQYTE